MKHDLYERYLTAYAKSLAYDGEIDWECDGAREALAVAIAVADAHKSEARMPRPRSVLESAIDRLLDGTGIDDR